MPLTDSPSFQPALDVHVLRGDPPTSLWQLLQVSWPPSTGTFPNFGTFEQYRTQFSDVVIELRPVFDFEEIGTRFTGFNIEIDQSNGLLKALKPQPPEPAVHNFVVEAMVRQNGTTPVPASWAPTRIRVHVHQSVERIWMTPSRLTIHRPTATGESLTNFRFTVRAQFDDGTVADITSTKHYRPDPIDAEFFRDTDTGVSVRLPPTMGPGSVRTLSVQTTPAWNSRSAHADLAVLEHWDTAPVPKAQLIDGHPDVWDGTLKLEKVPNIVFIGSGFRPLDMDAFEKMTNTIVHKMKTAPWLFPYNILSTSMNFWRIFLPGPEAGVSVRCEVYSVLDKTGERFAFPVPPPAPPPDTGAQPLNPKLTLNHLLHVVGLPIPADVQLVRDPDGNPPADVDALNDLIAEQIDFTALVDKFRIIKHPLPLIDWATVPPALLKEWLGLAERTFIDEIDCCPPLEIGVPPTYTFDPVGEIDEYLNAARGYGWHPGGTERSLFLRRVSAEPRNGITLTLGSAGVNGPAVGNLWSEDRPEFTFDNRPYFVMIPYMPISHSFPYFGRSQMVGGDRLYLRPTVRLIDPPRDLQGLRVQSANGRHALVLDLPPLSAVAIQPPTWEVFAHELGHAFRLGDEYTQPVPVPAHTDHPDITSTASVLRQDLTVTFGLLKWNWHRIRKARVLALPVDDSDRSAGIFRVFVAKTRAQGGGPSFVEGDKAFLRHRDPRDLVGLGLRPVTSSVEFVVESVHDHNITNAQDVENMTIVLTTDATGIDVSPFGKESIIYTAIPFPDPARPFLTVVSPAAERIMDAIKGPMNGKVCDTSNMNAFRAAIQVPRLPLEQLETLAPMLDLTRIVGAYYGGGHGACDALRPAGSCTMRSVRMSAFCAVCRFALVDLINPDMHGKNDLVYEKEYLL